MTSTTLRRRLRPRRGTPASPRNLRPDIQGLRAIAVLSVVLDHLLGWPLGGFVGVDIFFVISGFLITGHLLRTQEKNGRLSFGDFYRKRVKRILPAALLVLVVTVSASYFVFNRVRADDTLLDGIWSLLFGANWRQIAIGTDYFAASGPVSPLQHYWSLAVEEQFYFVWPVLMFLAFLVASRWFGGRSSPRTVALVLMTVITVSSFGWGLWETAANPVVAYFSTFDRAWELGVGALLAIGTPQLLRIPARVRPFLAWVGLAGLVVAFATITADAGFPAPAAALPVLATAVTIAAGTGADRHRSLGVITNPVARYLGDISYSIYLWHFPVVIFGLALVVTPTVPFFLFAGAVILALSVLSYHLVEDPIRQSPWLTGTRHWVRHYTFPAGYKFFAVAALVSVTAALAVPLIVPPVKSAAELAAARAFQAQASSDASPTPAQHESFGPATTGLQQELARAVTSTSWPTLSPSIDDVLRHNTEPKGVNDCGTQTLSGAACVWGNKAARNTAVLAGDSIAISWMPALIELYGHGDWNLRMLAKYGCPFTDRSGAGDSAACIQHRAEVAAEIAATPPTLLIVANNYPDSGRNAAPWGAQLASMLTKARGAGSTVVIAPPPHSADVKSCYRPTSSPLDCLSTADGWYGQIVGVERQDVMATGVAYAETEPLFCTAQAACPSFAGNTPTKLDAVHPTVAYATKLAPALAEAIALAQTQAAAALKAQVR